MDRQLRRRALPKELIDKARAAVKN